ncbi:hypothetical protein CMUS01_06594 [Colletotrichum musicola]|uniref:Uncharacterized protein n=1 Tax=Colletotrichum musicola TaxID=2175873 RepID=A0A8H6KLV9_9PEZI|nr:hypothetical protein CMUS01_06594 [Colletotrichum musicola]
MSALSRVPPEVHELFVSNLESPTDVKSWISASTVNFSHFLVCKAEIFDTHIGLHLLPEALTILQLRQIHERSNPPVEVGQLVDVACESLKPNGPLSPRSFVPDDFDTIVSLLDLADEMNCILLGMYQGKSNGIWPFWNPVPRDPSWTPLQHAAHELFRFRKAILTFELHIQALYRNQPILEGVEDRQPCNRLESVMPSRLVFVDWVSGLVYHKNSTWIQLASRKVVAVNPIDAYRQQYSRQNATFREPAQTLLEALGDPVVLSASAHETVPWSYKGTLGELESLRKTTIDFLVQYRTFNLGGSRVGTLNSDAGDKTVHRLVCKPENDPFRIEHSPEFLFQRDENGLAAIASLQTIRGEKDWDQLDTIHYIWQLSSGGISPVARMLRLTEMERQEELIYNYVPAPASSRADISSCRWSGRWSGSTPISNLRHLCFRQNMWPEGSA